MEWNQEYTRERVKVLEKLEELRRLQDLRAKREAKAAQRAVIAVAAGLRPDTSEALECSGDVVYRDSEGVVTEATFAKGVQGDYRKWRMWYGGLDKA